VEADQKALGSWRRATKGNGTSSSSLPDEKKRLEPITLEKSRLYWNGFQGEGEDGLGHRSSLNGTDRGMVK
jgi:hypothetical protein